MSNVVQFRRSTAILALVAASIGGGLIAAFAVNSHSHEPVSVVARADTSQSTQRVSQLSNSFADVIEKASPAVVTISSTRVIKASEQQGQNPFSADPFFKQFFGGQGQGKPRDQRERGLGSGVIVSPSGYILTNNHVVDKATTLKIALSDGRNFTAKTIGTDPQTDLAVVKIDANDLPTLPFGNSSASRVGDLCFAIGNPFSQDHTVTMGIVSAKGRKLEGQTHIQDFIQTDAAINPGNSGGALINAQGQLIGINTMILTGGGSPFGGGEGGNVGIGFAVPSNMAKQVMDQIEKNGKVSRGYLGATLGTITPELAPQFGLKDAKGALVDSVADNGPAKKAGLQMGDVITAIDGKSVKGSDDLTMDVIAMSPGSSAKLDVMRNGKPMQLTVALGQRPNAVDWDQKKPGGNDNGDNGDNDNGSAGNNVTARGITVENLTPEIAQQINIPASTKGVVVDDVDQSSPAADANALGKGAVILAVNRQPVSNVGEFKRLMNQANGKAVLLTVNVGGQTAFTVVQP